MIIKVDMELEEFSSIPNADIIRLVEEIVYASKRECHLFIISLDIALWIYHNLSLELSQSQRYIIRVLGRKYKELKEVESKANVILHVKNRGRLKQLVNGHWYIGYKLLIGGEYLNKPVVVVENIKYDGEIYDMMLKNIERTEMDEFLKLNYTFHHGGGKSMADVLEYMVKNGKLTLCICDTDYLVPKGSNTNSETTFEKVKRKANEIRRRFQQSASKNKPFFGKVLGTPGRELENFFPPLIVKEILKSKKIPMQKSTNTSINFLNKLMYDRNDFRKYEKLYLRL